MSNKRQGKSHRHANAFVAAVVEQEKPRLERESLKLESLRRVHRANSIAAGATLASVATAIVAAAVGAPMVMAIAVAMAGVGAVAAVKKLRVIQPFLQHEQDESRAAGRNHPRQESKSGHVLVGR